MADEAAIAAPLQMELRLWAGVRVALVEGNLLHARTRATSVRLARELVQRMAMLTEEEVSALATSLAPDRAHLMWAAMCRRYPLVADFAESVLREHFLLGQQTLTPEDFDRFWAGRALWHPELDGISASTRRKLRTNLFLALRQSGMLSPAGVIVPPLMSEGVSALLRRRLPSDLRFFPVR
jgi:hypothetical protein